MIKNGKRLLTGTVDSSGQEFLIDQNYFKMLYYAHAVSPIPHSGGGGGFHQPFDILEFLLTLLKVYPDIG